MATTPTFSTGGLASGLDTASIIDQLTNIESAPITLNNDSISSYRAQISALGDLLSNLNALKSAGASLKTSGVINQTASSATDVAVTPTGKTLPGNYTFN